MVLNVLLHVKPARLLICLKNEEHDWYISSLARKSGMTYVYATRVLRGFESKGLVSFTPRGKLKIVRLTDKGLKVANDLDDLVQNLSQNEEPLVEGAVEKEVPVIEVKQGEAEQEKAGSRKTKGKKVK